jgi:hypothetical protein
MCGIVSIVKKKPGTWAFLDTELLREMLVVDSIRGADSTGVFGITDAGNAEYVKIASHPFNLLRSTAYKDFENKLISVGRAAVGHNRKATEGAVNNTNAHPFSFGHIILVHNGHISNFRSLMHLRDREKHGVVVDSHAIAALLATVPDPIDVIKELHGAFALVWYNAKTRKLSMCRNEQRPLHFAQGEHSMYIASEPGTLGWLLGRHGIETASNIAQAKHMTLISINLDAEDMKYEVQTISTPPAVHVPKPESNTPVSDSKTLTVKYLSKLKGDNKWDIYYGTPDFIEDTVTPIHNKQIVFEPDDYNSIGPETSNRWQIWGNYIGNEAVKCITTLNGTEKDVEALLYSPHLIGFVRNVTTKYLGGAKHQEVIVSQVRECTLNTFINDEVITEDHYDALSDNAFTCACGTKLANLDKDQMYLEYDNNLKPTFRCRWCIENNNYIQQEKEEKQGEVNPDSALLQDE